MNVQIVLTKGKVLWHAFGHSDKLGANSEYGRNAATAIHDWNRENE